MAGSSKTWAAGAGVAAVVLMAGTWFLAVSPTLSRASETRTQTESTEAQNASLQATLDALKADEVNLPQYQAELAALRAGIPTSADLTGYMRAVDALATEQGVVVTAFTPSTPADIRVSDPASVAADAGTAAPAEASGDSTTDSASDEASAAPTAEAAAPATASDADSALLSQMLAQLASDLEGFQAVPISITVIGPFPDAQAFLESLQSPDGRLLLVSDASYTGQDEQAATDGRPATQVGDAELVISGYLYVLDDPLAATEVPDPAATTGPAQVVDPGRNPITGPAS